MFRTLIAATTLALAACVTQPPMITQQATGPSGYPLSPQQRVTTAAEIYHANLDARIDVLSDNLQDTMARAELAAALLLRFRVIGRIEDGERALALAREAAAAAPGDPAVQRVNFAALSAFHLFDQAQASLARLEAAGADGRSLQRDLRLARGDYAPLEPDFVESRLPVADFYELASRADLRLMSGDPAGAAQWYRAAQDLYTDVDPLPLAWLYTQQGIALLRHGQCARARVFFSAALARLPRYYLAAEHLAECEAELGELEAARSRYLAVIEQTGNPEFLAALAAVEVRRGDARAAGAAREAAHAGYRQLLARWPAAYAQHAAEFYLDDGQVDRAHALALRNLELRQDIGSLILLAQTAAASGDLALACESAVRARATGLRPPELSDLDSLAVRCPAIPQAINRAG
ncbi:MAG: hypothetical protein IPK27_12345 [Rhodanobacteraceae bacterium]|nr:hypothetical protein [Rhodanobacteraceae bacterium]